MTDPKPSLLILIPIRDDWEALSRLLPRLDAALAKDGRRGRVVAVDDGSETRPHERFAPGEGVERVDVLRLRRNLGHQQAIAVGLAWCAAHLPGRSVVVMDGDGQDDPADVPRLCAAAEKAGGREVIFAERTRRSEDLRFRFFYVLYRMSHWLLTGRHIRFGNFSLVPYERVRQLVVAPELMAHYAAAVVKCRIPHRLVATRRRPRAVGEPGMNFVALVVHGFNALSVFGDEVVTRVLVGGGAVMVGSLGGALAVGGIRLFTDLAIPGWATTVLAFLVVLFFQAVATCLVASFVILSMKHSAPLLPERDHALFVDTVQPHPGSPGDA
jgi:hypothetical protein